MKYCALPIIFLLTLNGCISLNQPVLSDATLTDTGIHFQTYYITANRELPPDLSYSIESAIGTKMSALGYRLSNDVPDLYIYYDIYEDGFTTLSPITQNLDNVALNKKDKLRKYKLKRGAIYISLFNKDAQQVIWRGISDGYSLNPRIVRAKAFEIMDQYRLMAAPGHMITAR